MLFLLFFSFKLVYFLASKNGVEVECLFKVNSEFVSTKSTNFKYTNQNTRLTNHNTNTNEDPRHANSCSEYEHLYRPK